MPRILFAFVILQLLRTLNAAPNCHPHTEAAASTCTSSDQRHSEFRNLDSLLKDARDQEHLASFLVNVTIGMYKYMYPCSRTGAAVLDMYFEGHPIPGSDSSWWQDISHVLGEQALVGRRRRDSSFQSEIDLLNNQLDDLVHATGHNTGCINLLIQRYQSAAADAFKRTHPNFHPPTTPPPSTTTTPTTTTTTTTTTTPVPTTTTTVKPASCTDCEGLQCLLATHVVTCPAGNDLCITVVQDKTSGREIVRKCANRQTCDQVQNDVECVDIETRVLSDGIKCDYCCFGDNCNKPPQLLPDVSTLYQAQP